MNIGRRRARRPDDWPSSHVRARSDLSDRLDFSLEPDEAAWLETHLGACPDCRSIEAAYAAQRLELRALRDRTPAPPRDLWARTSAAIDAESRFRDRRGRSSGTRPRRAFAPPAILATALVVAVAVGLLTSSQWFPGDGGAGSSAQIALGTAPASIASNLVAPAATEIPVTQKIAYLAKDQSGDFTIKTKYVDKVCPSSSSQPCNDVNPTVDRKITLDQAAATVFGSPDDARLIVINDPKSPNSGTISVVPLGSEPPPPSPTESPTVAASIAPSELPTAPPTATATATAGSTPSLQPASPPPTASPEPSDTASPAPSVAITPTPNGAIEIANDVVLVGQSAAYASSGDWFAFTARPVDESTGPDIFVWHVGAARANRVTNDHRSIFGSWVGELIVGSTLVDSVASDPSAPADLVPTSFVLDPATDVFTAVPQAGRAWRPAVDPTGRRAVYWAGSVRRLSSSGFVPGAGRLVLGDWGVDPSPSGSPIATSAAANQGTARHETTIAAGQINDWDARWDSTGTHIAIWIADPHNPSIGLLNLYAVNSFDGKIDLKAPLLKDAPAVAGYSISSGQLVWAEPPTDGAASGRIQLLAWTDEGVGTVGTVTGPVIVIR